MPHLGEPPSPIVRATACLHGHDRRRQLREPEPLIARRSALRRSTRKPRLSPVAAHGEPDRPCRTSVDVRQSGLCPGIGAALMAGRAIRSMFGFRASCAIRHATWRHCPWSHRLARRFRWTASPMSPSAVRARWRDLVYEDADPGRDHRSGLRRSMKAFDNGIGPVHLKRPAERQGCRPIHEWAEAKKHCRQCAFRARPQACQSASRR